MSRNLAGTVEVGGKREIAEGPISREEEADPPCVMPDVRIPEWEERRPPRQCNSQKGRFIADSSQGSCRIQRSGAGSESPEPKLLHPGIG